MGYRCGLAGPSEMSAHSREQLSSSSIATVVDTPITRIFVASCCPLPAAASIAAADRRRRDGCRWRSYKVA